jgi:hypothetical protein
MIAIEKNSVSSKDGIISRVKESVQKNDLRSSFHIIRGSATNSNEFNLIDINSKEEFAIEIKALVDTCKNNKKSRHQVDYIVASFVSDVSVSKAENLGLLSKKDRDEKIDNVFRETIESESEKSLCIFILSEESVEMYAYGIIQSDYKGVVTTILSPEPTMSATGDNKNSLVLLGIEKLKNFFELEDSEKKKLAKNGNDSEITLHNDAKLFPTASTYIINRNSSTVVQTKVKNKTKIKFGY